MKKILILLSVVFLSAGCNTGKKSQAPTWHEDLVNAMNVLFNETIPYCNEFTNYTFDIAEDSILIKNPGSSHVKAYSETLEAAGYSVVANEGYKFYSKGGDDAYLVGVRHNIVSTLEKYTEIFVGFPIGYIEDWPEEAKEYMMAAIGELLPIPVVFEDFIYQYDEAENVFYFMDEYMGDAELDDFLAKLLDDGYRFYDPINYDILVRPAANRPGMINMIELFLVDDMYVAFGAFNVSAPTTITEWPTGIKTEFNHFFKTTAVPFPVGLSAGFTYDFLPFYFQHGIFDAFVAESVYTNYITTLTAAGFSKGATVEGLTTYSKDDLFVEVAFDEYYGFQLWVGTTADPVFLTDAWGDEDLVDFIADFLEADVPVVPYSDTYVWGFEPTFGELYIFDYRCGDITEDIVDILEAAGFENKGIDSYGYDVYADELIYIAIGYIEDENTFQMWIGRLPRVVDEFSDEMALAVALLTDGLTIPFPVGLTDFAGYDFATDGTMVIFDGGCGNLTTSYGQTLTSNGFSYNATNQRYTKGNLTITLEYDADGYFVIYLNCNVTSATKTGWSSAMNDLSAVYLGSALPTLSLSNSLILLFDQEALGAPAMILIDTKTYSTDAIFDTIDAELLAAGYYGWVDERDGATIGHYTNVTSGAKIITFYDFSDGSFSVYLVSTRFTLLTGAWTATQATEIAKAVGNATIPVAPITNMADAYYYSQGGYTEIVDLFSGDVSAEYILVLEAAGFAGSLVPATDTEDAYYSYTKGDVVIEFGYYTDDDGFGAFCIWVFTATA